MKLQIGERLVAAEASEGANDFALHAKRRNAAVYVVEEVVSETLWHGLYRARKVFRNAKGDGASIEEADEAEWLRVLLKTVRYTRLDDREYVRARRDALRFECKRVLGLGKTNLLPEPLDFLEVQNLHDIFAFPRLGTTAQTEPLLVLENIAGDHLAAWRSRHPIDVPRALRLVSEMLELLRALHESGFLAPAIGPVSFWIDAADRIYFVATDGVVSARSDARPASDRLPTGFAPPDVLRDPRAANEGSDLYAWAALAYFLLTGESPSKLAIDRGERYAVFGDAERARLAAVLQSAPRSEALKACELLGATGARFRRSYPGGFVQALMQCLSHDPRERPAGVAEFRERLKNVPPPRALFAIALRRRSGERSIMASVEGLDPRLKVVVRRTSPDERPTPQAGTSLYDGPASVAGIVDRQAGAASYVVFIKDEEGGAAYSAATVAEEIDLARPEMLIAYLRRTVGDVGAAPVGSHRLPAPLALFASRPEAIELAEPLLASPAPAVRGWAIDLLAAAARSSATASDAAKMLFERGLTDPSFEVRLYAARAIFAGRSDPGLDLTVRVVSALAGSHVDDRIRVARALRGAGLSQGAVEAAVQALEADRIVYCGECREAMKARELDEHLRKTHRYVDVDTDLVPLGEGLKRLWKRLLLRNDAAAGTSIVEILELHAQGEAALAQALPAQARAIWLPAIESLATADRPRATQRLATALGENAAMRKASRGLLASDDPTLRELGRSALIPEFAASLAGDSTEPATFRKQALALGAGEGLDFVIRLCDRLVRAGASASAGAAAIEDLELDREIICRDCGERVAKRDQARHERLVHDRYILDGRTWERDELLGVLIGEIATGDASPDRGRLAYELVREKNQSGAADEFVRRLVARWNAGQEGLTFEKANSVAGVVALLDELDAAAVGVRLLTSDSANAGAVALALASSGVLDLVGIPKEAATRRLASRDLDERLREGALVASLRRRGPHEEFQANYALLSAFVKPAGDKLAQRERLKEFRTSFGAHATIDSLVVELDATMRVQCPLCQQVMNGEEMRRHAQQAHQRIWTGRKLRHPRDLADECLEQYVAERTESFLEAGERYATLAEGDTGRRRFALEALRRCGPIAKYLGELEQQAAPRKNSICASCFELLPSPRRAAQTTVQISANGDLNSEYVDIRYLSGFLFREAVISRRGGIWHGPQPTSQLSRTAAVAFAVAISAAFLVATAIVSLVSAQLGALAFLATCVVGLAAGLFAAFYRPRSESALSLAWQMVVPTALSDGRDPRGIEFVVGLASASENHLGLLREAEVAQAATRCEELYGAGVVSYAQLASLYRVLIRLSLRNRSKDRALALMSRMLHAVATGKTPADFLDVTTVNGEAFRAFSPGEQLVLRWRFVDSLRAGGSEPFDVDSIEQACETLKKVFTLPYKHAFNATELAYAVQNEPPQAFRDLGGATAFQWAAAGDVRPFDAWPGIVAASPDGEFTFRTDGFYFREHRLDRVPVVHIREITEFVQTGWTYQRRDGGPDLRYKHNPPLGYDRTVGFVLIVDSLSIRCDRDPRATAERLRRWASLWFDEVVPRTQALLAARHRSPLAMMQPSNQGIVVCRNCGRRQTFVEGRLATPA